MLVAAARFEMAIFSRLVPGENLIAAGIFSSMRRRVARRANAPPEHGRPGQLFRRPKSA
jgi:hypothetical protein